MVSLSTCHLALDGNLVLVDLVKCSRSSDQVGFIESGRDDVGLSNSMATPVDYKY